MGLSTTERGVRAVGVELVQDLSHLSSPVQGYLRRLRHRIKTILSDGSRTDTYVADVVDRAADMRDAVTIAVYARPQGRPVGETRILLRRQLRYGAFLATGTAVVTELLAGVMEDGEAPEVTAARELGEEASILATPEQVARLGGPIFVLPSILTERIYPMAAEVTPEVLEAAVARPPPGDGTPFEAGAELLIVSLDEARRWMAVDADSAAPGEPILCDLKTELVLARLERALEASP
jgi:8-oxo-dGTP pyrophosphatase MutT (NUDIX family)